MKSIKIMIHKNYVSSFLNLINRNKWILFFLSVYLLIRIIFLNTNSAEWGDSYRILRATEFLQNFTYPADEKRPPLFSILLLLKFTKDPIFSGRITMLILSMINVFLFYLLCKTLLKNSSEKTIFFAVTLFAFNPLFIYWSLRIYADNFFLMWMLLSFILYFKYQDSKKLFFLIILPFVLTFSILTRFEGYLLSASIVSSLFLGFTFKRNRFFPFIYMSFVLALLIFLVSYYKEYTFYINPIFSKYIDEVESRKITLDEVNNFIFQFLYLLGSVFGIMFILVNFVKIKLKTIIDSWVIYAPLVHLFFLQFVLSFIWFAAVPRLFLPIVPILLILFVKGFEKFKFEGYSKKLKIFFIIVSLGFLVFYIGSQLSLKLPFLITGLRFFLINIFIGILCIFVFSLTLFKKIPKDYLIILFITSNIVWSILFVSLEKDIYKVLNQAVLYFKENYPGDYIVLSNDVSSITRFYLKDNFKYSRELDLNENVLEKVEKIKPEYIIVTNEHNHSMSFTPSKYPGFELQKEFKEKVNSRVFFTQIIKVTSK
jgi:4-amino-4-deoxy-L-arabinose transferase-like glycosyltransferase